MPQRTNLRRGIRTTQPTQQVGIARSASAFAERCALAWTASVGPVNMADERMASTQVLTATPPLMATRFGVTTVGNGSQNERLEFGNAPTAVTFPITFLVIFRTFSDSNAVNFVTASTGSNGVYLGVDTSKSVRFVLGNGGGALYLGSLAIPSNDADYIALAASYNPATGAARAVMKNLSSGAISTGSGSYSYTNWGAGSGVWVINPGAGTTKMPNRISAAASLYACSDAELRDLVERPWHFLAEDTPRKRVYINADSGSGLNSYTYAGSGGFTLAGTAPLTRNRSYLPTGGLTAAGTAPVARGKVYTPTGGVVFAGAAPTEQGTGGLNSYTYTGSGGFTLAGTAPLTRNRSWAPAGGISLAGVASLLRNRSYLPTGGISIGGQAATESPAGPVVSSHQLNPMMKYPGQMMGR